MKRKLCLKWFLVTQFLVVAFLLASCGKDSRLNLTEERVPSRPLPPVVGLPSKPVTPAAKVYAMLSNPPATIRLDPYPKLVPPGHRRNVPLSTDIRASFTLQASDGIRYPAAFAPDTMVECSLYQDTNRLPLHVIHFEAPPANPGETTASLTLMVFGPAKGDITLHGLRSQRLEPANPASRLVNSLVMLDLGGEPEGQTFNNELFKNGVFPFDNNTKMATSNCRVTFQEGSHAVMGETSEGSFVCDDLGNTPDLAIPGIEIERMRAQGTFRCPLSRSSIYPTF
jgi:hypothetical protein